MWEGRHNYGQSDEHQEYNEHQFDVYSDKQLYHLVVSEHFDFASIARLMSSLHPTKHTPSDSKADCSRKDTADNVGLNCSLCATG